MINEKIIEELFNIPTNNVTDNRYLRIMLCDNPIKYIYVFYLKSIKNYFNLKETCFEKNIIYCTYKYDIDLNYKLKNNSIVENDTSIKISTNIINNAIHEIKEINFLLNQEYITNELIEKILKCNLRNYIKILKFCSIIDTNKNICHSKILSRISNLKKQLISYLNKNLSIELLAKEFGIQKYYINNYLNTMQKYNLYNEDFIIYTILFDIKHTKNNLI